VTCWTWPILRVDQATLDRAIEASPDPIVGVPAIWCPGNGLATYFPRPARGVGIATPYNTKDECEPFAYACGHPGNCKYPACLKPLRKIYRYCFRGWPA